MAVQRQALIDRVTGFDTTPRQLLIDRLGITLITYTEGGWQVQGAIPRGTTIDIDGSHIPIRDLMPVLNLLPAPQEIEEFVLSAVLEESTHHEGDTQSHPEFTCQELAGFRSVRSAVLRETWEEVRRRERNNEVVTNVAFGNIMEGVWARAKEATRSCPLGQGITGEL